MSNKLYLLIFLSVLLLFKFGYLPYVEFISDKKEQLQLENNKKEKIESLLGREDELLQYKNSLVAALESNKALFVDVDSLDDFKLKLQQDMQDAAVLTESRVVFYDWTHHVQSKNSTLNRANVTVRIAGKPHAVARFQVWLDNQKFIAVKSAAFNWSSFLASFTDVDAQFDVVVMFRLGQATNQEISPE